MSIRILIADDHALLRQGIKNALSLEADLEVIGEASNGEEVLNLVVHLKPDIVLLDINMPKGNGLEITRHLAANFPSIRCIILTIHDDEYYVMEVIKAGASGYLLKDVEASMLIEAIRVVHAGESFIYPTLAKKLFSQISRLENEQTGEQAAPRRRNEGRLTYREAEVLQLMAQGLSNHELAARLFLSEKTVKNHLTNIFRKIHVTDRTQAVIYAIKHKIVTIE